MRLGLLVCLAILVFTHAARAQDAVPPEPGANAPATCLQLLDEASKDQHELKITLQYAEVLQTENAALKTKIALLEADREENEEMKVAFEEIRAELAAIKSHTGYAANKTPIGVAWLAGTRAMAAIFLQGLTAKKPEPAAPLNPTGVGPARQEENGKQ